MSEERPGPPRRPTLYVACWEALYSDHYRDRSSVLPTLELLQRLGWIEFSHRPALSLNKVVSEIDQWLSEEDAGGLRSMLYLAGHGDMGRFEALEPFGQAELGEALKGRLAGRVVHIGACNSASPEPSKTDSLTALKRITRATKVTGYTKAVDWVESAAFETLLFSTLAFYERPGTALSYVTDEYQELADRLGFVEANDL